MTTPYERERAVRDARELLTEISAGRLEFDALKKRATSILRHYPGDMDMSIAAACAPTVFSEAPVARFARREPSGTEMEMRAVDDVLGNTLWLTAEMVGRMHDPNASNIQDAAHSWKKAGRIFSIERTGQSLYPLYVFDEFGNPIPEVAKILRIFTGYRPFRVASWFESTNAVLHGKRPREVLGSDPAAVVEAARDHVVGPAHG